VNNGTSRRVADLSPAEKRALLGQLLNKNASDPKLIYPLSYNQQGIWFLYQLAPESSVYNVNFAARISSEINVPALRRALQKIKTQRARGRACVTTKSERARSFAARGVARRARGNFAPASEFQYAGRRGIESLSAQWRRLPEPAGCAENS